MPRCLQSSHGYLPKDQAFIDYIDLNQKRVENEIMYEISKLALKNNQIRDAFAEERVLLKIPLEVDEWKSQETKTIMKSNNEILQRMKKFDQNPSDLG